MNTTSRKSSFTIAGDHPPELLGNNKGAAAAEVLLAALGHCIANGFAMYGAHMGIPIESLTVDLEGDIDLQGMLGLGNVKLTVDDLVVKNRLSGFLASG